MSAAGANDGIIPEEPGVAGGDVNDTNAAENAAPPVPPAAAEAAAGGGGGGLGDNTMMDLSPYFNTLIDTLHRNNDTTQNAAAAGANNNNNNNNNAPQLRSMMVSLLWNGAEQIAIAARASFAQQQPQGGQGAFFAVDTIGGRSDNAVLPPKFAAVYLYAVAQNIVALEEIVLQAGQGVVMDVMDGGISIKQVAEIVSVSAVKKVASNLCVCAVILVQL